MTNFISFLAPQIKDFIYFRKASGKWNECSYESNLKFFDAYVASNYQETSALKQDMVDGWCGKRDTEMNNSCRSRIYALVSFIRYLKRTWSYGHQRP